MAAAAFCGASAALDQLSAADWNALAAVEIDEFLSDSHALAYTGGLRHTKPRV